MTTILLLVVCLLGIGLFVLLGALVELFEQVKQIRAHLNLYDSPTPLVLGAAEGVAPSSVGLPATLDDAEDSLVLFLSNKCETCFQLADTFAGGNLPPRLWVVVVPVSGEPDDFVERFELHSDRVVVDVGEQITGRLGLDITPAALVVERGTVARAQTVPTVRQLLALLPSRARVLNPKAPLLKGTSNGSSSKAPNA